MSAVVHSARPKYAIVRVPDGADLPLLFSTLLNIGFTDVNFVSNLRDVCPGCSDSSGGRNERINTVTPPPVDNEEIITELEVANLETVTSEDHMVDFLKDVGRSNSSSVSPTASLGLLNYSTPSTSQAAPAAHTTVTGTPSTTGHKVALRPKTVLVRRFVVKGIPSSSGVEGVHGEKEQCQACNCDLYGTPTIRHVQFMNHIYSHTSSCRWGCSVCPFESRQIYSIKQHMATHARQDKKAYVVDKSDQKMSAEWCELAKRLFPTRADFICNAIRKMNTFRDWRMKRAGEAEKRPS